MNQILDIPLNEILPHPANRKIGGFDQAKLEQLAESIKAVGVQQPAVVRPGKTSPYELVAGERRWRASRIAGIPTLPCIVRDLDDATTLRIQIIENLQREDVHPLDEADGYARLIEDGKYDVEAVASELGKSASYVYQRLKLRELIPSAREMLVDGTITAGHAILIARLGPEQQELVIKEAFRGWRNEIPSVRAIDEWIHREILMELAKASWKKDDAILVPAAGSCSACPKRTGFSPALFADVGKKDHCLDRACFAAKGVALVARKREELKGEEHLEVFDGYSQTKTPTGVLESWEWTECKKKDEGAVKILVVDGATPGRITYGKKRASFSGRPTTPEEIVAEKENKAREKRLHKAAESVRRSIYDEARKTFEADLAIPATTPVTKGLRLIEASAICNRLEWNSQKYLAKHLGWEVPKGYSGAMDQVVQEKIKSMSPRELEMFIFDMCFVPNLQIVNGWSLRLPDKLSRAADVVGIDLGVLIADAAAEYQVTPEEVNPPERDYIHGGYIEPGAEES